MRVLFIGGTGNISSSVSRLALAQGIDLHHLNRGQRAADIPGVKTLHADIRDTAAAAKALAHQQWDCVVNWIAFTVPDVERDLELFRDKTAQYIFISSASVYQKPPTHPVITESTPLYNPYWEYSRNKIACEDRLMKEYRERGFPITIVRPSLTYDTVIPVALGGWTDYTIVDRIKRGLPIIVHGDGSSLWVVTHAEDFGRGFIGLLGNDRAIGHAFHITSDEVLTWDQIYRTIAGALGVEANIVHIASDFIVKVAPQFTGSLLGDKSWSVAFDNSKVKAFVPGFQATIPFRDGIRRTLAWFDADERRKRIDPAVNTELDRILEAYGKRAR